MLRPGGEGHGNAGNTGNGGQRGRSRPQTAEGARTTEPVFTSRLTGRRLLGADGLSIGRVSDVVILQPVGADPPRALGLVVSVQRRQIFVSLGRIGEMSVDGVYLNGSSVDLGHFSQRAGEVLASKIYDKPAGTGVVLDIGIGRAGTG